MSLASSSLHLSLLIDEPDFGRRLFKSPKGHLRQEKTANDALVSDLPSETLRWIKKRRNFDSGKKVVLSHHRERQLREIFQGIDIGKKGVIDLKEINEAVSYVQGRLKNVQGLEKFRNIQSVFSSMDDNGDGTVDFQEFTNAMTGSSESALDTTEEHDIEKLYRCFVEFGVLKHRKKAVEKLAEYTGYTINLGTRKTAHKQTSKAVLRPKTSETYLPHQILGRAPPKDVDCYNLFKTLFGNEESTFANGADTAAETIADKEAESLRQSSVERILEEFMEANRKNDLTPEEEERQMDYYRLQETLRESRKNELLQQASDPDAVALQQRILADRRHNAAAQKLRAGNSLRPITSNGIRKSTAAPITLVPIDPNTKQDQFAKLSAKKEAYEIIKNNRSRADITRKGALHEGDEPSAASSKQSVHSRISAQTLQTAATHDSHASSKHSQTSQSLVRSQNGNSVASSQRVLTTSKSACLSVASPKFAKYSSNNVRKSFSAAVL